MDCEVKLLKSGLSNRAATSGLIKFPDQALDYAEAIGPPRLTHCQRGDSRLGPK
jgi:hypothetical protein